MAATSFDPGPFHGTHEGYAKFYLILSLAEAFGLLAFPWIGAWLIRNHHPGQSFARVLPISPLLLVLIDFLGLTLIVSFVSIYQRLSARIAAGGAESAFLDKIRLSVLALTQSAIMLLFVTAISIRR